MTICVNKPVRFVGDHDRPVHVAGWLRGPDGSEAVAVFSKDGTGNWWKAHRLFNKETGRCIELGSTLVIENAPHVRSGFFPLYRCETTNARGLITLDMAKQDYPEASHFIEIVSEDEVPKEVKIHAR